MLSRKKPSTPARHNDPKIDEPDTPSPSRRRPVRARYFRRTPLIANLWLRFQRFKDEPLTWLIVLFLATLLLAAGTLLDGKWHVGRVGTEVEMVKNGSNATSSARTPWSFFTFTDINITQSSPRFRSDVWPEPSLHPKLHPVSPTAVARDRHGLYITDPLHEKKLSEHPITTLIRAAERKAAEVDAKIHSIQSFEDSVEDYRRAFGMDPPRGFSKWYEFAIKHDCITAPSLLSDAHLSVRPYLAYSPDLLRERMNRMIKKNSGTWYFDLGKRQGMTVEERNRITVGGGARENFRARDVSSLVQPLLEYIPDQLPGDDDLRLLFSVHDGPAAQSTWSLVDVSNHLVDAGLVWDQETLDSMDKRQEQTVGWDMVCQRQSHLSKNSRDRVLNHEVSSPDSTGKEKSFIEDHVASFDYCHNPSLARQHGTLIVNARRGSKMTPVISYCKTLHNTDIMGIALDSVNQTLPLMDWKEKTIDKVIWRGSFTGAFHSDAFDWPNSQRERMVKLASSGEDRLQEVLVQGWKRVDRKQYSVAKLNERFLDIAPVGGPVQWLVHSQLIRPYIEILRCTSHPEVCDRIRDEFQFAEPMTPETALKYKYTVDIDGNGWSSRFRRLLTSNSVLKSTIFPEWNSDILIPWYHYVPLKVDYSDIYDIMVYFAGSPDGRSSAHDHEAEKIARRAREFALARWRWQDMQSYMLLMIYQRMLASDRGALDIIEIHDEVHAEWSRGDM